MQSDTKHAVMVVINRVRVAAVAISFMLTLQCFHPNASSQSLNTSRAASQSNDEHIRRVLERLEPDNTLRYALESGKRGSGVHYTWMDEMRRRGIKQASFRIRFSRCPKQVNIEIVDAKYLQRYYRFDAKIDDESELKQITESGLDDALTDEILIRAQANLNQRAGAFRLKRLCGTLYLNLLDDELLPILDDLPDINTNCDCAAKN